MQPGAACKALQGPLTAHASRAGSCSDAGMKNVLYVCLHADAGTHLPIHVAARAPDKCMRLAMHPTDARGCACTSQIHGAAHAPHACTRLPCTLQMHVASRAPHPCMKLPMHRTDACDCPCPPQMHEAADALSLPPHQVLDRRCRRPAVLVEQLQRRARVAQHLSTVPAAVVCCVSPIFGRQHGACAVPVPARRGGKQSGEGWASSGRRGSA
eukprot:184907-Chlamydomonas_euryale.AAC.9